MQTLFTAVRFSIIGLTALALGLLGRWVILAVSGDGQAALLVFAFMLVAGLFIGNELAKRLAVPITDRIVGGARRDR